jgi:hypothetical protein
VPKLLADARLGHLAAVQGHSPAAGEILLLALIIGGADDGDQKMIREAHK